MSNTGDTTPCPFCGHTESSVRKVPRFPDAAPELQTDELGAFAYTVACHGCAAEGGWAKSERSAIRNWNMRPYRTPSTAPVSEPATPTLSGWRNANGVPLWFLSTIRHQIATSGAGLLTVAQETEILDVAGKLLRRESAVSAPVSEDRGTPYETERAGLIHSLEAVLRVARWHAETVMQDEDDAVLLRRDCDALEQAYGRAVSVSRETETGELADALEWAIREASGVVDSGARASGWPDRYERALRECLASLRSTLERAERLEREGANALERTRRSWEREREEWQAEHAKLSAELSSLREGAARDVARLDWLEESGAETQKEDRRDGGSEFFLYASGGGARLMCRRPTLREAIDAAMSASSLPSTDLQGDNT